MKGRLLAALQESAESLLQVGLGVAWICLFCAICAGVAGLTCQAFDFLAGNWKQLWAYGVALVSAAVFSLVSWAGEFVFRAVLAALGHPASEEWIAARKARAVTIRLPSGELVTGVRVGRGEVAEEVKRS